jgi:regulator of replication initiation timing
LSQLNAITDGSDSTQDSELNTLKNDLKQLIQLSEESLLELKKQQLLKKLNDITGESTETSSTKNIQQNKADSSGEDLVGNFKINKIDLIRSRTKWYLMHIYACS